MSYNIRSSGRRVGDINPLYRQLTAAGVIKEKRDGDDRRKGERRIPDELEKTDPIIGSKRKDDRRKKDE